MRKLKLLFVALLSSLCCFAFAGCEIISLLFIGGQVIIQDALDDTPSLEERRLSAEITEGGTITEITQDEDGWYVVKAEGAIKNLGDKDADEVGFIVSYYDEYGYLLDSVSSCYFYLGAGETCRVECENVMFYRPATARIHNVELYQEYDYNNEKTCKERVEVLSGEVFACTVEEDGSYLATVTGQVKLLEEGEYTVNVFAVFYDVDGYVHYGSWSKAVKGPAERTYTVECASNAEIVSYKILYGTTLGFYY